MFNYKNKIHLHFTWFCHWTNISTFMQHWFQYWPFWKKRSTRICNSYEKENNENFSKLTSGGLQLEFVKDFLNVRYCSFICLQNCFHFNIFFIWMCYCCSCRLFLIFFSKFITEFNFSRNVHLKLSRDEKKKICSYT